MKYVFIVAVIFVLAFALPFVALGCIGGFIMRSVVAGFDFGLDATQMLYEEVFRKRKKRD